jgi:hypothetical protein
MLKIDSNQTIIVGRSNLATDAPFVSFPPPGEQAYNIVFQKKKTEPNSSQSESGWKMYTSTTQLHEQYYYSK